MGARHALNGFVQTAVASLRRENDGKADILFYDSLAKGATLAEGLQKAVEAALAALPIPKVMSYQLQDGWSSVNFVRPAHGLVALHGSSVVPVQALGLTAGKHTQGHRFEAKASPVVSKADCLPTKGGDPIETPQPAMWNCSDTPPRPSLRLPSSVPSSPRPCAASAM